MTRHYLLIPGQVTSKTDGQRHWVTAAELVRLYGVDPADCIVFPMGPSTEDMIRRNALHEKVARGDLTALNPKHSGDYTLPPPGTGERE